jgi:hypothetical protein
LEKVSVADFAEVNDNVRARSLILSIQSIDGRGSKGRACEHYCCQSAVPIHGVLLLGGEEVGSAMQAAPFALSKSAYFARLKTRLGVNVPCDVAIEAEVCISSSPLNVTDALRASPSKFGVVARSAV